MTALDARTATFERTGAKVYVELIDTARPPFPERVRDTTYESAGRYLVQVGDAEPMKWGIRCGTLEEACAVLLGVVVLYRARRTRIATGFCVGLEAATLSLRVAEWALS